MGAATDDVVERPVGDVGPRKKFVTALHSLSSPAALATRFSTSSPARATGEAIRRAKKRRSVPTAMWSRLSRKTNKAKDHIVAEEQPTASKTFFLLGRHGNIESGSFDISFDDLLTPPSSNPLSPTWSTTSTYSHESDQSETELYIPLRRYPTIRPGGDVQEPTPNTTTTTPPQPSDESSTSPGLTQNQEFICRRPRRPRSYSGLEERIDPLAHLANITDDIISYFTMRNATTAAQRRECLYELPWECRNECAHWLSTHPHDQWDSAEEEEQGFSRMYADEYVEAVERAFKATGLWEFDGEEVRGDESALEERAKVVGWVQARQETCFDEEWITGNGIWGKGEGCAKVVGPDGEVA